MLSAPATADADASVAAAAVDVAVEVIGAGVAALTDADMSTAAAAYRPKREIRSLSLSTCWTLVETLPLLNVLMTTLALTTTACSKWGRPQGDKHPYTHTQAHTHTDTHTRVHTVPVLSTITC